MKKNVFAILITFLVSVIFMSVVSVQSEDLNLTLSAISELLVLMAKSKELFP